MNRQSLFRDILRDCVIRNISVIIFQYSYLEYDISRQGGRCASEIEKCRYIKIRQEISDVRLRSCAVSAFTRSSRRRDVFSKIHYFTHYYRFFLYVLFFSRELFSLSSRLRGSVRGRLPYFTLLLLTSLPVRLVFTLALWRVRATLHARTVYSAVWVKHTRV